MAYAWSQEDHISILELQAVPTEIRRIARRDASQSMRYFHVVDSRVAHMLMAKGRSSSKRMNRVARRIISCCLMSNFYPLSLWTLSKWNFADGPSRRYAPIK